METIYIDPAAGLIQQCLNGDQAAYAELYGRYSRAMLNTAFRVVNDREAAEDILQESFISAFRNLGSYRADSSFGAWIKRIVVNRSISWLRQQRTVSLDQADDVAAEPESEGPDFPCTAEQVRTAIFQLPDGYRTVLSLYLLEGYDHEEIGQILGISESTSKSQFSRARKKLISILKSNT
ncbi:MAG: RNA polymerase sigma factor [Bacteroidota bacterium]